MLSTRGIPRRSFLRFSRRGTPALAALFQNFAVGMGSARLFAFDRAEGFVGCNIDEVGMLAFDSVEPGLDVLLSVLKTNQNIELCVFSMDPSRATDKFTM
jgi:hypothetical protein